MRARLSRSAGQNGGVSTGLVAAVTAAAAALTVVLATGALPAYSAPTTHAGLAETTDPAGSPSPSVSPSTETTSPTPTETSTPTPTPPPPTPTPTVTPPPVDDRLLPDLISVPARQFVIKQGREVRRLRFTSSLANVGLGPLEVRPNTNVPCPEGQHNSAQIVFRDSNFDSIYTALSDIGLWRHRAGCMVFHPKHDHWHFKAAAQYTLVNPRENDVVVSARRKVSFCLRDSARVPEQYGTWGYPEKYGACTRRSPQGISVGWMDIYQNTLAGQALPLPEGLTNGLYCLWVAVDPIQQLVESRDDNNSSVRAIAIRGDRVLYRPASLCL